MTSNAPIRPSDLVAAQIVALRHVHRWTTADLADQCAKSGATGLTRSVIANIETGRRGDGGLRRRNVTVDELVAFANVFGVSPVALLAQALTWEGGSR